MHVMQSFWNLNKGPLCQTPWMYAYMRTIIILDHLVQPKLVQLNANSLSAVDARLLGTGVQVLTES